jgi:hypothetical protein
MRWRMINTVLLSLLSVLGFVVMYWTVVIALSPAPGTFAEIAMSYGAVVKTFFHPLSLPNASRLGAKAISNIATNLIATGAVWCVAYIASAQPYSRWLRISGSVLGLIATIVWVGIAFSVFIISGQRH